jgi:hypothetical protein
MTDSRDPSDIPFPANDSAGAREPGSDDDTPLSSGPSTVEFYELPFPDEDEIPLPEERGDDSRDASDSHAAQPIRTPTTSRA